MNTWLTLSEAALAAKRSERTIRNWVEAGLLRPVAGRFRRDALLHVEREMRGRIGRPRKNK